MRCGPQPMRCGPQRRGWSARLKTRLLLWFVAAILLAFAVSSLTVSVTRPEGTEFPAQIVAKHVQNKLAQKWEDPRACAAIVHDLREATGLDFSLERDPNVLPKRRRRGHATGGVVFDGTTTYVPIVRDGEALGALALRSSAPGAAGPIRLLFGLFMGGLVLSAVARKVAKRISSPLEQIAQAAERFGTGDLAARTGIDTAARGSRHIADEVREVAYSFDEMAGRIERVVRDQRELLAAISHEIRSPLGRARVGLEMAREEATEVHGERLAAIDRELREVDAILGDLLAAARAGLSDVRLETIPVLPWLRSRLATLSRPDMPELELDDDGIELDVTVSCDKALLGRALENLVNNAVAHGHATNEPITVRVEHDARELRIVVRDRGPGIPEELLPRMFEPFVKGDKARTPGRGVGTGLGLALVLRIAEAHGGKAFAKNRSDVTGKVVGAEVGIVLPRS